MAIHGYLVLAALIYAIVGTTLTHLIGWPLISLNFRQQRFEADFRFNLVRSRENSEQIASLNGEAAERERHLLRFGFLADNWIAIMQRTKKLTFFTASYSQASVIFPYVMVSPAYFSGGMQLGGLMQTASAFNNVQGALSYFVTAYQAIAEFQAVVTRLSGFERAIETARAAALTPPVIEVVAREASPAIAIDHLAVGLPNGSRCSMPTTSRSMPATACWSPGLRAPASRRCSAPLPASGRSDRGASPCRSTPR